ncbi:quinone oxidoreductase family protein [Croceicoccus naphthovorans]|uniref:Uncharacterized protein n=1 Tax=Croceicoccus naphthovorans TaxID=1348774 RepID=A0A0G3XFN1_9SPHN|nr:NADP-dependent oxidoreductase [Croceicoccus naphthovorans]AKM09446.1 hypothetical protein AB433_04765 [Croceicoccus naphthovorans]MBB3991554.1 NADPH:quinone reductase-like Zn-dependent oxidoreductase [Croceicoccus naphthovorans]
MKAIAVTGAGGLDDVGVVQVAEPRATADEIAIKVHAAGLNPADWKLAEGWLAPHLRLRYPQVLGFDAAGVIVDVGAQVAGFSVGDRVVAKTSVARGGAGSLAEIVTVPAKTTCKLPDTIAFSQSAAVPTAGVTAFEALLVAGGLRGGQTVLVNGGAGGTGSFALALARKIGAKAAATARRVNHDRLGELGAIAFDYTDQHWLDDFYTRFPGGVDVVLDTVGQGSLPQALDLIRPRGRLVAIGTLAKGEPVSDAEMAAARGISVITAMASRGREGDQLRSLIADLEREAIPFPQVEVVSPCDCASALRRIKGGHVSGKIVVDIAEGPWR